LRKALSLSGHDDDPPALLDDRASQRNCLRHTLTWGATRLPVRDVAMAECTLMMCASVGQAELVGEVEERTAIRSSIV